MNSTNTLASPVEAAPSAASNVSPSTIATVIPIDQELATLEVRRRELEEARRVQLHNFEQQRLCRIDGFCQTEGLTREQLATYLGVSLGLYHKRIPNSVKDLVLAALKTGTKSRIVADKFRVSIATVNNWKAAAGLTHKRHRRNRLTRQDVPHRLSPVDLKKRAEWVNERLRSGKVSVRQIARELKVSAPTVYSIVHQNKIQLPGYFKKAS